MNSWMKVINVSVLSCALMLSSLARAQGALSGATPDTTSAGASATEAAAPAAPAADSPGQRIVCKQTAPIGTRIAKKTCKTVDDWNGLRGMANEAARTGAEQSRMIRDCSATGC